MVADRTAGLPQTLRSTLAAGFDRKGIVVELGLRNEIRGRLTRWTFHRLRSPGSVRVPYPPRLRSRTETRCPDQTREHHLPPVLESGRKTDRLLAVGVQEQLRAPLGSLHLERGRWRSKADHQREAPQGPRIYTRWPCPDCGDESRRKKSAGGS